MPPGLRWLSALFGLVGAGAFAVAVQAGKWWSIAGVVEIGPHRSWQCFKGECVPAGMSWIGASAQWERFGIATWAAGLVGALAMVLLAAAIAAGRVPRLLAKMALVSVVTALAASTAFVAKFPGVTGAELDRGALLYIVAMVFGAAAAVTTLRTPTT
jgi:hypothetical protein